MKKTTLVFVLLLTTIALWLIAMTTPGWFVSYERTDASSSDVQASVFYKKVCKNQECTYTSYYNDRDMRFLVSALGFESQVETIVAFVLFGISCILVTLPDSRCNRKRILSVVTFTLIIAETTALIVIFRTCVVNAFASTFAPRGVFLHSPYSIFFAGFSLVAGIVALVFNYVALRSLINRDAAGNQYFGLATGDQHDYNQVLEDNFRSPNEANEGLSQNTDNTAANYQYMGLASEEPHVYDQVPQDNLRRPNDVYEDLPVETNKMA